MRWRRLLALTVACACTWSSSLVTAPGAPAASAARRSVMIVGDSVVLALAASPYTGAADRVIGGAGWDVWLSAWVGRSTSQTHEVLLEERARWADAIVINSGYNDAAMPSLFASRADALLDDLAGVEAVFWLTLRETKPYYATANDTLRALQRDHPNLRLIEWNAKVNTHAGWTGHDGLHLSGSGATGMAQLILDDLERWHAETTVDLSSCSARTAPAGVPDPSSAQGYWVLDSAGTVHGVGVEALGSSTAGASVVGIERAPGGYWVVDSSGRVEAFGAAAHHGDLSGVRLNAPIVAMRARADGQGYWLLGRDGGIFSFGAAGFFGSTGDLVLQAPVTTFDVPANGAGYWLNATDGGVFTFGDIGFHGSAAGRTGQAPIVQLTARPDGSGYWVRDRTGNLSAFGAVTDHGSVTQLGYCRAPAVADLESTPSGLGYWQLGTDGSVFAFGDAAALGSVALPDGVRGVGLALA